MESVLSIFFKSVVAIFTFASTILAGYSIQNKWRLRKIRLSWRSGKLMGYPLFATTFLLIVLILGLSALAVEDTNRYWIFGAYTWISFMWFISSYLASKYYITDHGIVKNINEPSQTIPWYQILDFVEKEDKNGALFQFTYNEENKTLTGGYKHLRLKVPQNKYKGFKKIVSYKLENRFTREEIPDINFKGIQED